jgi:hypothetical protein
LNSRQYRLLVKITPEFFNPIPIFSSLARLVCSRPVITQAEFAKPESERGPHPPGLFAEPPLTVVQPGLAGRLPSGINHVSISGDDGEFE